MGVAVVTTWFKMVSTLKAIPPTRVGFSFLFRRLSSANPAQEQILAPYVPVVPQSWITSFETGEKLGIVDLNERIFGRQPRIDIMQRVVVWQRAKIRAGTARVKTRDEVRGGGRKPWPQKGLGKARQGSIRAPHWRGGGRVHGPRGPVSYDYALPKKIRALGLRSALVTKYAQGDLYIVDTLAMPHGKRRTADLLGIMENHKLNSVLLVDGETKVDLNLAYASQNISTVDVLPTIGINVYSILLRDKLVLSIGALRLLEDRLGSY